MLRLMTLSVLVNLFLLYSIFDIHFKSPIVPVTRRYRLNQTVVRPPAKRVIFFSADGLRAKVFIDHPEYRPFMRKLIEKDSVSSVWGVADAKVPTESRPCHVALFAGFYEDPSAVFAGWAENYVPFDSIFNQTSYFVGIGPDDQIKRFSRMAPKEKILAVTVDETKMDFDRYSSLASSMDAWTLYNLAELMGNNKIPRKGQLIIFMHFFAPDKKGHAHLPDSFEYNIAMKEVDAIVKESQSLVQKYFQDDDTLFVLSSDHGMSTLGEHGEGSAEETEIPFLIWGNGIKKKKAPQRLRQIDFTPLLAGALGVDYPSNNLGRFPTSFWSDELFALEALKANFLQFYELMMTKKQIVESGRNFGLFNFGREENINQIRSFVLSSSWAAAGGDDIAQKIEKINDAMTLTLEGILYYERYDSPLLMRFTVVATSCWILILGFIIVRMSSSLETIKAVNLVRVDFLVIASVSAVLIIRGLIGWSSWRIPYGFFPAYLVLLLVKLLKNEWIRSSVTSGVGVTQKSFGKVPWIAFPLLLIFSAISGGIIYHAFEKREILSLGLILSALWCIRARAQKVGTLQKVLFLVFTGVLAIFPWLPPMSGRRSGMNPMFTTLGPIASVSLVLMMLTRHPKESRKRLVIIVVFQMALLLASSYLVQYPGEELTNRVAWSSVILSFIMPLFVPADKAPFRLMSIFLGLACPFTFTSLSYEALFLPYLFLVLFFLVEIESSGESLEGTLGTESKERRVIEESGGLHQAVRRAWLHLFFASFSFFGTTDIASINWPNQSIVACFADDEIFTWTFLLVLFLKIMTPLLLVSIFFRRLLLSRFQLERNFLIMLFLCQGMTLHTIFNVKNEGTWLEMGSSIIHHLIVSLITLYLLILHFVADFMMAFELWNCPRILRCFRMMKRIIKNHSG